MADLRNILRYQWNSPHSESDKRCSSTFYIPTFCSDLSSYDPDLVDDLLSLIRSNPSKREQFHHIATKFSSRISVDPDNQLPNTLIVFKPDFSAHNDYSGSIREKLSLGPVKAPPRKTKLPFYNQSNLQLPQEEADKLEALGVLAKPENIGVDVVYVSPSFSVKKLQGGHQLVIAFNDLGQYSCILPPDSNSCN